MLRHTHFFRLQLIVFIFLYAGFTANAQTKSGYFGSFHGLEFRVGGVPSIDRIHSFSTASGEEIGKRRLELLRMNYKVNYSFIEGRNSEFLIGYEYSKLRSLDYYYFSYQNSNQKFSLLEDIKFQKHGVNFEYRYYRKGSLAPTGKYFGLGLSYARASVPDSIPLLIGQYGSQTEKSNFLSRKSTLIAAADTVYLQKGSFAKYSAFTVFATMGRNYPITERILLNFNLRVKVVGFYSNGFSTSIGVANGSTFFNTDFRINDNDLELKDAAVLRALNAYNRMQLELGIRYYL